MAGYFTVKSIGTQVYQLFEEKNVSETLIIGAEKALLIDTGYGHPDLLPEIRKLTDKPLIVMNSHLHPDHSNGNKLFAQVYVGSGDLPGDAPSPDQAAVNTLSKGLDAGRLSLFWRIVRKKAKEMLAGFQTDLGQAEHLVLPEMIDLGGRVLHIMDLPGHSPGSVIVLDPQDRAIYTGDAINGDYWAFTNPAYSLRQYQKQVQTVAQLQGYDTIWLSHQKEPRPFAFVSVFAEFLGRVSVKRSRKIKLPGFEEPLCIYSEKHPEYNKLAIWFFPQQLG